MENKKTPHPANYWTYEKVLEESKKYTMRSEFCKGSPGAFDAARKNKWLDNFTWLVSPRRQNGHFTYDVCYEIAKQAKTKSEFQKLDGSAYNAAKRNGWLKDYTWFEEVEKPSNYWTYENCMKAAEECKSRKEFRTKYSQAYKKSSKNKWIDDWDWLKPKVKPTGYWDIYENVEIEALKYKTRTEFQKNASTAYDSSLRHKWIDRFTWLEKSRNDPNYWTKEKCAEVASKYNNYHDFVLHENYALQVIQRNGWFEEMCGNMIRYNPEYHYSENM